MRLTHRHIEVFRAVMLAGQVTRAAEVLHTSQPTVSRELARMEQVLGYALFERDKGRMPHRAGDGLAGGGGGQLRGPGAHCRLRGQPAPVHAGRLQLACACSRWPRRRCRRPWPQLCGHRRKNKTNDRNTSANDNTQNTI